MVSVWLEVVGLQSCSYSLLQTLYLL